MSGDMKSNTKLPAGKSRGFIVIFKRDTDDGTGHTSFTGFLHLKLTSL